MITLSNSIQQPAAAGSPARLGSAVESVWGAAVAGSFGVFSSFANWVAASNTWVFFFLALKPLIDLTWRWSFFRISASAQPVNTQVIVGLAVLGLNAVAILKRAAWRTLPRRVLFLLAFASLSVLFSPSSWGFNELLRLLAGTTFFYTAGPLLADPRQFDRFAKVFLCAMTLPVLLSYFQWAGILPYDYWDWLDIGEVGRASGTYPTPLSMSFFLYFAFPVALYVAGAKNLSSWSRRGAVLFLLLASGALAFGNHRTAYVIIALQILVWLVMAHGRKAMLAFLGVLALTIVLSFSWLQTLFTPVQQALSGEVSMDSDELFRGRGFQWFLFLNSYASSGPFHWVFGNGASLIAGYDPEATDVDSVEPHNDFIRILHAYGLVGLLLYLSTLGLFLKKTLQLLRSPDNFPRAVARIMLLSLIAISIQSMMMEPMRYPTGVWYFFAMASTLFCIKTVPTPARSLRA